MGIIYITKKLNTKVLLISYIYKLFYIKNIKRYLYVIIAFCYSLHYKNIKKYYIITIYIIYF